MSPAEAAWTLYGAATAPLQGQVFVSLLTPNMPQRQLYFSLFDNGDRLDDSAVFIDNIPHHAERDAGVVPQRCYVARLGPGYHGAERCPPAVLDTPDADAAGHGLQRGPGTPPHGPPALTTARFRPALPSRPLNNAPAARRGRHTAPQPLADGQIHGAGTQSNYTGSAGSAHRSPSPSPPRAPRSPPRHGRLEQPAGLRRPRQRRHPRRPGHLRRLATADPRKDLRRARLSGNVFISTRRAPCWRVAVNPPKGFVALKGAANVPMGAQLDTRKGRVAVTSAQDTSGSVAQTADFYDGIFAVKQSTPRTKPAQPKVLITDLGASTASRRARSARRSRAPRRPRPRRRSAARSRSSARCGATARARSARTASPARPPSAGPSG